ncbi:hypothetical protein ILUMI_19077 [Ignelater luminosus]|uniref:Uncharacterized protein n=1 Tax=Ignelater luminosus TaxID=2038154 RepID=A0A8K0CNT6_IGNLU|nr:hypothetical protein ILUMI_19077 [Ignelater luminosus]
MRKSVGEARVASLVNSVIGEKDMRGVDVLLSTAMIEVIDINGDVHMCRTLLDGKIDLLGVEIFYSLLCIGQISFGCDQPLLLLFSKTVRRHSDGRFVMNIPFKRSPSNLSDSRENALRRFYLLEKRFIKNPEVKGMYINFMEEHKLMGHISLVETQSEFSYYLPHHGVLKNGSLTSKLSVVFNGSAPSDNGISLSDLQCIGPIFFDSTGSVVRNPKHFGPRLKFHFK